MNYKVLSPAGPWKTGDIITDEEIKALPGLGGVARLRDKKNVIEDTDEKPTGDGDRSAENTTGKPTKAGTATEIGGASGPNAGPGGAGRSAGKS